MRVVWPSTGNRKWENEKRKSTKPGGWKGLLVFYIYTERKKNTSLLSNIWHQTKEKVDWVENWSFENVKAFIVVFLFHMKITLWKAVKKKFLVQNIFKQ